MTFPLVALLDTNWYIAALSGDAQLPSIRLHSVVTRLEILSFSRLDAKAVQDISAFLSYGEEIPLDDEVVQKAAELRRHHGGRLPDAVIAASAALYEVPVLTLDRGMLRYRSVVSLPALEAA